MGHSTRLGQRSASADTYYRAEHKPITNKGKSRHISTTPTPQAGPSTLYNRNTSPRRHSPPPAGMINAESVSLYIKEKEKNSQFRSEQENVNANILDILAAINKRLDSMGAPVQTTSFTTAPQASFQTSLHHGVPPVTPVSTLRHSVPPERHATVDPPPRPCSYCNGNHWNRDCPHKPSPGTPTRQVRLVETSPATYPNNTPRNPQGRAFNNYGNGSHSTQDTQRPNQIRNVDHWDDSNSDVDSMPLEDYEFGEQRSEDGSDNAGYHQAQVNMLRQVNNVVTRAATRLPRPVPSVTRDLSSRTSPRLPPGLLPPTAIAGSTKASDVTQNVTQHGHLQEQGLNSEDSSEQQHDAGSQDSSGASNATQDGSLAAFIQDFATHAMDNRESGPLRGIENDPLLPGTSSSSSPLSTPSTVPVIPSITPISSTSFTHVDKTPVYAQIKLANSPDIATALVDTGAGISLVSEGFVKKFIKDPVYKEANC